MVTTMLVTLPTTKEVTMTPKSTTVTVYNCSGGVVGSMGGSKPIDVVTDLW